MQPLEEYLDQQRQRVEVILDKSQRSPTYTVADLLSRSGVPVRIDAVHKIAHNKVVVLTVDRRFKDLCYPALSRSEPGGFCV